MSTSRPKALLASLLISYIFTGVLLLALSFILYKLKLKEAQINTAVYGVYAIACFAGGFFCGKTAASRRFFWGLLSGLLYFAVLVAVSICLRQGQLPEGSLLATVLACCAAGGMAGGMCS